MFEDRIRQRQIFSWSFVRDLVQKMESKEFLVLKQVMALVILELWQQVFVDGESIS